MCLWFCTTTAVSLNFILFNRDIFLLITKNNYIVWCNSSYQETQQREGKSFIRPTDLKFGMKKYKCVYLHAHIDLEVIFSRVSVRLITSSRSKLIVKGGSYYGSVLLDQYIWRQWLKINSVTRSRALDSTEPINALRPYLHRADLQKKKKVISKVIISTHVKISRLLWKLLPSTYFCCQTTSVTAFKPWSAFAADSTIMAGKWPVKFFWGAWHFAYIINIQRRGKCVKNEVYEKSSN